MKTADRPAKGPFLALMGTFGETNAGDDILLLSVLEGIRLRRTDCRFAVFTGDRGHTGAFLAREGFPAGSFELIYTGRWGLREPGLTFPRSLSWIVGTLRRIGGADLLLIGPGTQFQDITRRFRLLFFLGRAALALVVRTPYAFIGMGYWRVEGRLCRSALRFLGNRVVFLSTRDAGSAFELAALGIRPSVLHSLADISFVLAPKAPAETRREGLAVHVRKRSGRLRRPD